MELRPYQNDLIEKARNAYRHGARAPCIVLPCGGGKSVIVADIANLLLKKIIMCFFLFIEKNLLTR